MKNRDLINALAKLPLDVKVYVSVEQGHRPNSGPTLLASAISKVESREDAQAILISPVRRPPKSFARIARYNPSSN